VIQEFSKEGPIARSLADGNALVGSKGKLPINLGDFVLRSWSKFS